MHATRAERTDRTGGTTRRQRRPVGSDPLFGSRLGGRYIVGRLIGHGGMARVFEGHDELLDSPVAIKVLDARLVEADADLGARFRREARLACAFSHPNAVASYEHGQSEDGLLWLVMELCRGQPLSALLQAEGRLEPARAVRIMAQVLEALEAAHASGVVHRDVKLSNVMIDDSDEVRVLDFGLAKVVSAADPRSLTAAGVTVGTPQVMSPEQCLGDACDARSDVYSAGVALYQLLSGRLPFDSPHAHRLLWLHVTAAPPPLRPACDLPVALERAVLRALEKDPDDRWSSARAFREGIEAALLPERTLAAGDRFWVRSRTGNRYAGRVAWVAEGRLGVDLEEGYPATLDLTRLDLSTLEVESRPE